MDLKLKGKTAIVTGSTAGIGYAIAKRLAEEGVEVVITGRNQAKLDEAATELVAGGNIDRPRIVFSPGMACRQQFLKQNRDFLAIRRCQ